ncbi:MAG: hypothetical protein K2W96_15935, partial [Gemmataceae bacterium]|nr:hypothetical protein [Gemmataceae bacterium]
MGASIRVPKLRRHKGTSQGMVRLSGVDHWCGVWPEGLEKPPDAVRPACDREVAEWLARGRTAKPGKRKAAPMAAPSPESKQGEAPPPEALTVPELLLAYLRHARDYYRHPDGSPTSEYGDIVLSLRPVNHLYAALPAASFSPLKLQAVQGLMASGYVHADHGQQKPLSRKLVNQRVGRIKRAWKWGVSREMV